MNLSPESFATQRANMVDGQLRPNKVNQQPILARFSTLPRENYVATPATAYLDQPAPIAPGREAYSPLVTARLVQALNLKPTDTCLVVASGSGYTASVVAPLCKHVVALEDDADLAKQAEANFEREGLHVQQVIDSPPQGYATAAPYNAVIIDAAFAELHGPWVAQLAEGGRLVGVRMGIDGLPEATLFTKHGNAMVAEVLFETKGTVHPAFQVSEKFVF